MEPMKLGWGGISLVSKALRISPNTIKKGIHEINSGQASSFSKTNVRVRKPGGGRKPKSTISNLFDQREFNNGSSSSELPVPANDDCVSIHDASSQ
jgi:hypothetical protein